MPASSAACLTGLGVSFRPRPAGRSGWVRTRECHGRPPATRQRRCERTPACRRIRDAWEGTRKGKQGIRRARLRARPLQLGLDAVLLEVRQVFHEHLAVQMVQLVLHTDREQAVGLELEGLAVDVQRLAADAGGALDFIVDARHRQAAFFVDLVVVAAPGDLGIDQRQQLVAVFGHVDHDQALMHVHLRGGQTHAGRVVHGLGHVAGQLADALVDLGHGLGFLVQARVRVAKDGSKAMKKDRQ